MDKDGVHLYNTMKKEMELGLDIDGVHLHNIIKEEMECVWMKMEYIFIKLSRKKWS